MNPFFSPRKIFTFLFALVFFQLSATTKRALVIGIDKYNAAATTPAAYAQRGKLNERSGWQNLDGCVNDALSMRSIIQGRYGFLAQNIDTLFNEQASRKGIIDAITKLISISQPGDVVFIYYAGHGSQVRNSKSYDGTGWDQSIVPADQYDIRNKELAQLLNQLLDKGVTLTTIFDSCHSGSIARGNSLPVSYKERMAPSVDEDANDASQYPIPEERGALVFSAAQRSQTAKEAVDEDKTPHGAFTLALIKAINSSPSNQSAERLYARVLGIIKSEDGPKFQDPILGGTEKRRKMGIFGDEVNENSSKTYIAVLNVSDDVVTLKGGHELSIYEGCRFVKTSGKDTLEITSVTGIGSSESKIVGKGNIASFRSGDLVEMINWVKPDGPNLRIWTPETNMTAAQLTKTIAPAVALMNGYFIPVADPTSSNPQYVIQFNAGKWLVTSAASPEPKILSTFSDATLRAAIPKGSSVFLQLPATQELLLSLSKKIGAGTPNSAIEFTTNPLQANYILAGRMNKGATEYSLLRPNTSEMDSTFRNSLPLRTDWFNGSTTEPTTDSLAIFAVRLGKICAWLNLESPADNFPYHLFLVRNKTNELIQPGSPMLEGEMYHFALILDSVNAPSSTVIVRYTYIFTIDSKGKMDLFYPNASFGAENNVVKYIPGTAPTRMDAMPAMGKVEFGIGPPFGYDTYFLVTSATPLSLDVFESDGVMTRGERGNSKGALNDLLANNGAKSRGPTQPVVTKWSVQKFQFRSVAKKK
jgi:hypothetical protein